MIVDSKIDLTLMTVSERMSLKINRTDRKMENYPIGAKSFKFAKLMSGTSFICIDATVLFVCVLRTDKRP